MPTVAPLKFLGSSTIHRLLYILFNKTEQPSLSLLLNILQLLNSPNSSLDNVYSVSLFTKIRNTLINWNLTYQNIQGQV